MGKCKSVHIKDLFFLYYSTTVNYKQALINILLISVLEEKFFYSTLINALSHTSQELIRVQENKTHSILLFLESNWEAQSKHYDKMDNVLCGDYVGE